MYPHSIINISTNYIIDPNSSLHGEVNTNSSRTESKDLASTLTQQIQNIFKATEGADVTQDASEEAAEQAAVEANNHALFNDLSHIMGWGPNQVITIDEVGNIVESFIENNNEVEADPNKSSDTSNKSSDVNITSDYKSKKDSSSHESILPLLLIYKHSLINIKKLKTNWNKLITTPIILGKSYTSRKTTIKLILIALLSLPMLSIVINPLLITIFDESYLRFIIKHTTFYLDYHSRALDTFVNQLEAEANEIYEDFIDEDDPKLASDLFIQWQNTINTLNSVTGANNENIIIAENGHNIENELDNNSETENSDSDASSYTGSSTDSDALTSSDSETEVNSENSNTSFNPDEITSTSTPNTASHELEADTNSDISESIVPFLLIFIHQNFLTKLNKVKSNWNKLITTPIIIGKVKRGGQSNILKYIKYLSIFLIFILLIFLLLLFFPSLFENINLNYLLLISTNIFDYVTNHFYSLYHYCRDLYNIFSFTDNTSKIITPDTKLINDYNDNKDSSEIVNNKDSIESKSFYKSKTFIICGIVILTSALIYLYCNNLETISQQNIQYNLLQEEYLKLLEQKYSLIEFKRKYLELLNSFQLLQDGLDQNVENIEFIEDFLLHIDN